MPPRSKKTGTRTAAFGSPGRANHDARAFYGSRLYTGLPQEEPGPYFENPLPETAVNTIFCRSSEEMAELPEASVHLMVTSPPYNVGKDYDEDFTLEEYLAFLKRAWQEVHRVLVPGGRACVNLANLFLAQATGRVRETAIRAATGASRSRLIRQGLTESLVVSVLGAGMGLGLAVWGVEAITTLAPAGQIPGLSDVTINRWVLAFTLGVGVLTGVVTGLVPALQTSGSDAATTLRSGGRSMSGSRAQHRLRGALVAAEEDVAPLGLERVPEDRDRVDCDGAV